MDGIRVRLTAGVLWLTAWTALGWAWIGDQSDQPAPLRTGADGDVPRHQALSFPVATPGLRAVAAAVGVVVAAVVVALVVRRRDLRRMPGAFAGVTACGMCAAWGLQVLGARYDDGTLVLPVVVVDVLVVVVAGSLSFFRIATGPDGPLSPEAARHAGELRRQVTPPQRAPATNPY